MMTKICSAHAESAKLSPQTVGLLAVLAVSGSVAFLTLGKQRLWQFVFQVVPSSRCSAVDDDDGEERTVLEASSNTEEVDDCGLPEVKLPETSEAPAAADRKARSLLKKVRFAPDVVEPAGDGRSYRGKVKAGREKFISSKQECHQDTSDTGAFSDSGSVSVNKAGQGAKLQRLAKPNLPANRMALYSGMQRYRAVMADCTSCKAINQSSTRRSDF